MMEPDARAAFNIGEGLGAHATSALALVLGWPASTFDEGVTRRRKDQKMGKVTLLSPRTAATRATNAWGVMVNSRHNEEKTEERPRQRGETR